MKFRQATYEDFPFIVNSWAASMSDSQLGRDVDKEVFKIEIRARINRLLENSYNLVLDDNGKLGGFICGDRNVHGTPVVHFVYVAKNYRRNGVCTQFMGLLFPDRPAVIWATHRRANFRYLEAKFNLMYNPFILEVLK